MSSGLLDHTGSPIRREQRAKVASVRAKYDAAQSSRHNDNHWANTDSLSAASANSPEVRKKLRERARYEVANNSYAAGMVRTLANDIVGVGPQLQIDTGDREADKLVEGIWWKWWVAARMTQRMLTARMSLCVDGEVFALFTTNLNLKHPIKLGVKLYESEQIARPYLALNDPLMSDGIIYDDFGNPAAYTVLKRHPGSLGSMGLATEYDIIPAAYVVHLFREERPGQLRGVPEITSSLSLYAQLRRYTLAVLTAAEVSANLAVLLQTQQAPDDPDDLEPLDVFELERGSAMTLPRGWTANPMKSEQPTTTYADFKRQIIQEQARCLSQPYNVAAGDSSGMNYSSGRLDHLNYARSIRVDRFKLECDFLSPLFERWWNEARLVDVLPPQMREMSEPPNREWRWEGSEHQDPAKEANGQATRLQSNTTTLAREYARLGLDWEDELRQRAKEIALMKELGLPVEQPASNQQQDSGNAQNN